MFTSVELTEAAELFRRLKRNRDDDRVANYLVSRLSPATIGLLDTYQADLKPGQPLVESMVTDLNKVIIGGLIWDETVFAGVVLGPPTRYQLRKIVNRDVRVINRLLLQDAFPLLMVDEENTDPRFTIGGPKDGIPKARESWRGGWRVIEAQARTALPGTPNQRFLDPFLARVRDSGLLVMLLNIEKTQQALTDASAGANQRRDRLRDDMHQASVLANRFLHEVEAGRVQRHDAPPDAPRLHGYTILDAWFKRVIADMLWALDVIDDSDLDAII